MNVVYNITMKYILTNTIIDKRTETDTNIIFIFNNNLTIRVLENTIFNVIKVIYTINGMVVYSKVYKKRYFLYLDIKRNIFQKFGYIVK